MIDATHEAIVDKHKAKLVTTYEKQFNKVAKKAISRTLNQDYVLELIENAVSAHQPIEVRFPESVADNTDLKIVVF